MLLVVIVLQLIRWCSSRGLLLMTSKDARRSVRCHDVVLSETQLMLHFLPQNQNRTLGVSPKPQKV